MIWCGSFNSEKKHSNQKEKKEKRRKKHHLMMRLERADAALVILATLALVSAIAIAGNSDMELLEARASQTAIDASTEEMMRKLNELEVEFHKKKLPLFAARNTLLRKVPGFWGKVISNHPSHAAWTSQEDLNILPYIADINVRELENDDGHMHHYRVELTFATNPYFVDTKLFRDIRGHAFDEQSPVSGVKWMDGKQPGQASFFNFFETTNTGRPQLEAHFIAEIGHVFRYEFWPNPFTYHDLPHYHEMIQQEEIEHSLPSDHEIDREPVDHDPIMDDEELRQLQEAARAAEEDETADEQ